MNKYEARRAFFDRKDREEQARVDAKLKTVKSGTCATCGRLVALSEIGTCLPHGFNLQAGTWCSGEFPR